MPPAAHAQRLAARRRARYGSLRARQGFRLGAAKRPPSAIAACVCCARARVSRLVTASRTGPLGVARAADGTSGPPGRPTGRPPSLQRALLARRTAAPRAAGWDRTRWRGATRAVTFQATRGSTVSAAPGRRGGHAGGGGWTRATRVAQETAPPRAARCARRRGGVAPLQAGERRVCADARDSPWLPQGGEAWLPPGAQGAVRPPGQQAPHALAGALAVPPGRLRHGLGARHTHARCRAVRRVRETTSPPPQAQRLSGGVENDKSPQAKAVEPWRECPPRVPVWLLPTDGPRAHPIARACGAGQAKGTRNHTRQRGRDLGGEVQPHGQGNGPWPDTRSQISYEPAVTAALETLAAREQ